jgi:hypothetical protein
VPLVGGSTADQNQGCDDGREPGTRELAEHLSPRKAVLCR